MGVGLADGLARLLRLEEITPVAADFSGIVVGLVWNWIFDGSHGLLNHALSNIGLAHYARAWLAEPETALFSVAVIHMWKGFGWGFVILLAGLQAIPR